MADQSDVETALAALAATALYPRGASAPSVLGQVCRIYRGWPNAAALDADLAAGLINVTVFPDARHQRNTTRWPDEDEALTPVTPRLTIAIAGTVATIGGIADAGQIAGLLVDNMAVVHRTETGDTPELVAAVLASRIRTQRIALLAGATVTVPGARLLTGRVVADQQVQRQTRRQRQNFRVICWCPDPMTRDLTASTIDTALSTCSFIPLADGTSGWLRFFSSTIFDQSEDAALYRRDLIYSVDYATTVTSILPAMIFGGATVAPGNTAVVQSRLG